MHIFGSQLDTVTEAQRGIKITESRPIIKVKSARDSQIQTPCPNPLQK
jgi:hypothetical protein